MAARNDDQPFNGQCLQPFFALPVKMKIWKVYYILLLLLLLCLLTLTDHTQANTSGMLIMPAHDISKISPPILFKQLSGACTHVSPAAPWPAGLTYAIFTVGAWLVWAWPPFYSHPFFFPWKVIFLAVGRKSSCDAVYLQFVGETLQPVC